MSDSATEEPGTTDVPDGLVWHYTNAAGLLSILGSNTLWATAAPFLNDSGEMQFGADMLAQELHQRIAQDPAYAEFAELTERELEPRRDEGPSRGTFFILSAAQHWDLLAMWRLYGGQGESYAIGLDPNVPLAILGESSTEQPYWLVQNRSWRPVRYQPAAQRELVDAVYDGLPATLAQARDHLAAGAEPESMLGGLSDVRDDMEAALMLIKHPGFVDEREIRYCIGIHPRPGNLESGLIRYRATRYGIAPYLHLTAAEGDELVRPDARPLPVRAVAVSPSPNGDEALRAVGDLVAARGYGHVPVVRSSIPFRE
ncbi:DUF2971 domain-containing protein [Dermacoccaceae bacterium W4C1]